MPSISEMVQERLASGPLVLDGATGTELERRGVATALPLWSAAALADRPEVVEAIHGDYVAAGVDIVVANTFRTNSRALRRAGHAGEGPAMTALAVKLARRAADGGGRRTPASRALSSLCRSGASSPVLVAGSVGPVEDCYHPQRVPADRELRAEHAELAAWLRSAGADLIWIETMNTVREAQAASEAAAEAEMPFAVSFVLREDGNLLSGEPLKSAVAAVEPLGPLALGLNCIPPRGLTGWLPRLRRATSRPISAYAHINNPTPICGWGFSQALSADEYAEYVRQWLDAGASIVGGCCGTGPEHIRAVRAVVDGWRSRLSPGA
jgi:S-methylmethionine-dependent homocysteine/selenocysteine methylase